MKSVIDFNHISPNLSEGEVGKLEQWYRYYHKLYTCYKWKYRTLKRVRLSLNMASIGLVVIGSIAGGVTTNPVILGCISGLGVLIQGYLTKKDISRKVEMSRYAYTSYKKVLIQLRSFLRGMPYDEMIFLSDVKMVDDTVCDLCDLISGMSERYDMKYG